MFLIISNTLDIPIYLQIVNQLKEKIMTGELSTGELLPSIRGLAKDLRISVITTKRAYEELEREGYIETTPGKGSYVSNKNKELIKEEILKTIETHVLEIVNLSKKINLKKEETLEIVDMFYEGEENEKQYWN